MITHLQTWFVITNKEKLDTKALFYAPWSDDEPCLEVHDHCCNRLGFVSDVVFQEFLNILVVNSSDDGFDADRIQNGLESLLLPFHLVRLL